MSYSTPIWSEAQPQAYPRLPGGTIRADVAVIGGGLTGLSAAYHLLKRRPGLRLFVLEAERIGAGASGCTTGMLGPGVGQNFVSLSKRFGPERAHALYRATLRAVEYVHALVKREEIDCELEMTGQLMVARSPGGRARLSALSELLRKFALPHQRLDDEALAERIRLEPAHSRERIEKGPAGLFLPVAGILHPVRLLSGLAARVTALGGMIFEGARVSDIGLSRPARLQMNGGGEILADEVVVATAGYTPELGMLQGRVLPVHLQLLATEPLEERQRSLVGWAGREGVLDARRLFNYFRLTSDNRLLFGGGAPRYRWRGRTNEDKSSADVALKQLAVEMGRTFPAGMNLRVARGWTGVIGYVLDALPSIHYSRGRASVLHAVGWCGHGVALSVASGDWIAGLMCGDEVEETLPWFRESPPLIPFEPLRWVGFHAGVKMMSWLDQIA
ncbi:MAG: FAD-dependent oxidoreductase [Pyrinomonadaceae bacterium]